MLSVAQALGHPETPNSASQHPALMNPWSSERSNILKRRKTEPDCCSSSKKLASRDEESYLENIKSNPEVTLTLISKKNSSNHFNELFQGKIKTDIFKSDEKMVEEIVTEEERETDNKIDADILLTYFKNSNEIELTIKKSISQNELSDNKPLVDTENEKDFKTINSNNTPDETNKISGLPELTIEPCANTNKTRIQKSPSTSPKGLKCRMLTRTQSKLEKAGEFLKQKNKSIDKSFVSSDLIENNDVISDFHQPEIQLRVYDTDIKSDDIETLTEQNIDYITTNTALFDEEQHQQASIASVVDYEPFNVGIPCESFYTSHKEKPYYATGFPNPAGDNRCWINATLQTLFRLPVIQDLETFNVNKYTRLLDSLMNILSFWRKGITNNKGFNTSFCNFKEELAVLDKAYSSKAQQDVSEFILNLLNYVKTEFESSLAKQSHEIENIPNNEQDAQKRSQSSPHDSNKRLPLADISASAGQSRNGQVTYNGQQEISNNKNTSPTKSRSNDQSDPNDFNDVDPVDKYFSLHMVENYICEKCSKERHQKVENLMLFIDLPSEDDKTSVDLINMINTTYALEHRNMTCESCKHDVHTMVTKLKKLPKILTVQVKRYQMTNDGNIFKKSTPVKIPKILKLDSLEINNNQDFTHSPEYEPIAVISHIGDSMDSGHYISFVKHADEWFYYDDANVKLLSDDEVFQSVQNNAYLIFFQDTECSSSVNFEIDQRKGG